MCFKRVGWKEEKVEEELQARMPVPTSPVDYGTLGKSLREVARWGENWKLWVRFFFKGTNY